MLYLFLFLLLIMVILYFVYGGDPTEFIQGSLYKYVNAKNITINVFVGEAHYTFGFIHKSKKALDDITDTDIMKVYHVDDVEGLKVEWLEDFFRTLYYKKNEMKTFIINDKHVTRDNKLFSKCLNFANYFPKMKRYEKRETDKKDIENVWFTVPNKRVYQVIRLIRDPEAHQYIYLDENLFKLMSHIFKDLYWPPIIKISSKLVGPVFVKISKNIILIGEEHLSMEQIKSRAKFEINSTEFINNYMSTLVADQKIKFYLELPGNLNALRHEDGQYTKLYETFSSNIRLIPKFYDYRPRNVLDISLKLKLNDCHEIIFNNMDPKNLNTSYSEEFKEKLAILLTYEPKKDLPYVILRRTENLHLRQLVLFTLFFEKNNDNLENCTDFYAPFAEEITEFKKRIRPTKYSLRDKSVFTSVYHFEFEKLKKCNIETYNKFMQVSKKYYQFFKKKATLKKQSDGESLSILLFEAYILDMFTVSKLLRKKYPYNVFLTGARHTVNLSKLLGGMEVKFQTYGNFARPVVSMDKTDFAFR